MANVSSLSYSSTNVTTGAYVTFVASTAIPTSKIVLTDSSGAVLKLAVGPAGGEMDLIQMPVSGTLTLDLASINIIPMGSRLSLKAISGTASTGYAVVSLLQ